MCLLGMSFHAGPGLLSSPLWTSSVLVQSYTEFLCGALPRYRAFAIYSYFQTVVIPKFMLKLLLEQNDVSLIFQKGKISLGEILMCRDVGFFSEEL